MTPKEAEALDHYLTTPPEEFYQECLPEIDDTDHFGNTINKEDGVFEVTYEIAEPNEKLKIIERHETTAIVTQNSIVDLIEEVGEENVKPIVYVGSGDYYLKELLAYE